MSANQLYSMFWHHKIKRSKRRTVLRSAKSSPCLQFATIQIIYGGEVLRKREVSYLEVFGWSLTMAMHLPWWGHTWVLCTPEPCIARRHTVSTQRCNAFIAKVQYVLTNAALWNCGTRLEESKQCRTSADLSRIQPKEMIGVATEIYIPR